MRVYELAKELKLDSRRLIDLLHRLNVDGIKNHMSTVEPDAVQTVRNIMEGKLPAVGAKTGPLPGRPAGRPAEPARQPQAPVRPPYPTPRPAPREETAAPGSAPVPRSRPVPAGSGDSRRPAPRPPAAGTPAAKPTGAPARSPGSRPATPRPDARPPVANRQGNYPQSPRPAGSRPPASGPSSRFGAGASRPAGGAGAPNRATGTGPAPRPYGGTAPNRPQGSRPPGRSGPGAGNAPARPNRPLNVPPPASATTRPGKDANRRASPKERRSPNDYSSARTRNWDEERFGTKRKQKHNRAKERQESSIPPVQRKIVLTGAIMVKDLADQLGAKATDLIKRLINLGVMVAVNQEIDKDTAAIIASEMGAAVEERASLLEQEATILQGESDVAESLQPRPPVVTVMGHVDHGKTSLLDRIRSSRVTQSEAGGITQHIGASVVDWQDRAVVFLDTPGHEAFTAMRARGAQVTDIAVLVVAANDGVMPQTVEAINHAKAAAVPIVVAINKIDLPDANPDRVRTELTEHGLVSDAWGGDTMMVAVSARTGQGLSDLLDAILFQADVLELKANPERMAQGTIIEAKLDKGRGPVATVLVKRGTLHVGDIFVSGAVYGRVRALLNDRGQRVKAVGPSMPVEVLGFNQVPDAGDDFVILEDEKQAKSIADARTTRSRQSNEPGQRGVSLDEFLQRLKDEEIRDLNLVVKADVHGSAEALGQSVTKLSNAEARVRVLHTGVGSVTESDVMLAQASGAIIIGFGVGVESKARQLAEREHVDVRQYRIIYEVLDDIQQALTGMLAPKYQELVLGRAEVREIFRVPKVGAVGGCYVTEGKVLRSGQVRVLRNGAVVHQGTIASLRRFKDDVREVATGFECGIGLEKFNDIKVGDILEIYAQEEVKAS
ncbi:MAG: translation initiation factor IF-2 [Thermaerobacter sp.]|nr:translation initiation factor IF-2 [Thermaerobacter sp.]